MNSSEIAKIRRAHVSARPKPATNPAWANTHHDLGVCLAHIEAQDKLIAELQSKIVKLEVGYDKVHARAQKAEALSQKDTP